MFENKSNEQYLQVASQTETHLHNLIKLFFAVKRVENITDVSYFHR